jgi:hypothetical protein
VENPVRHIYDLSAQQIFRNLQGVEQAREALREARQQATEDSALVCKEGRNEDQESSLRDLSLAQPAEAGTAERQLPVSAQRAEM